MKSIKITFSFLSILLSTYTFSQFSCATAIPITNGYTSSIFSTPGTSTSSSESWVASTTTDGNTSANGFTRPDVYAFQYTTGAAAGESFYFTIECDYAVDGEHSVGVWTGCVGTTLSSCVTSTYKFDNVVGVCAKNLAANTTYYIGVGKEWASSSTDAAGIASRQLKFKVLDFTVETTLTIPSDECATAALINVANPYDGSTRCSYTASAGSPSACGMSIDNDSWMRFTAGSATVVIDYEVTNCTNGNGVQLSVFRGSCGALTLLTGSCVNYAANNSTGTWTFTGLTINNTYYIRTDGYAGDLCSYAFSPVSGIVILPIELSTFEVEALENSYNKLTWITESERNSSHFEIEKSDDGKEFYSVDKVTAAGNSTQKLSYLELDKSENSLITYYRLKLVDFDGKFTYSPIKAVKNSSSEAVSVYPNPSEDGKINIELNSSKKYDKISIYSNNGKLIEEIELNFDAQIQVDLGHLNNGIYQVVLSNDSEIVTKKVVLNK